MSDRMKSVVLFVFASCWVLFAINIISWYGR
jgi:hypothetical protein